MTMKHYIGYLIEENGEFGYATRYVFKTEKDPNEFGDEVAKTWRKNKNASTTPNWDKAKKGYVYKNNVIINYCNSEITEEEFNVLKKYLVERKEQ